MDGCLSRKRLGGWADQAFKVDAPVAGLLAFTYMSEPWAEEALRRVETDPRIAKALQGIQLSILTIITDGPADTYGFLYVRFDGKGLADYRVGGDYQAVTEGIDNPTFVVSGKYDVFQDIQLGTFSERKALLTGKLHLTGSMIKALRHMRALESITKVLQEIPVAAA